jgi:hypothetical protein
MINRIVAEVMTQMSLKDRLRRNLDADAKLRRSAIEPPEGVA